MVYAVSPVWFFVLFRPRQLPNAVVVVVLPVFVYHQVAGGTETDSIPDANQKIREKQIGGIFGESTSIANRLSEANSTLFKFEPLFSRPL